MRMGYEAFVTVTPTVTDDGVISFCLQCSCVMLNKIPCHVARGVLLGFLSGVDQFSLKFVVRGLAPQSVVMSGLTSRPGHLEWVASQVTCDDRRLFVRAIGYQADPNVISWYLNSPIFDFNDSAEVCETVCYRGGLDAIRLVRGGCYRNWGRGAVAAAVRDRVEVLDFLRQTGELANDSEYEIGECRYEIALAIGIHGSLKCLEWGIAAHRAALVYDDPWRLVPAPVNYIGIGAALFGNLEVIKSIVEGGALLMMGNLSVVQAAMIGGHLGVLEYLIAPGRVWPPREEMITALGRRLGGMLSMYASFQPPVADIDSVMTILDWWIEKGYPIRRRTERRIRGMRFGLPQTTILIGCDIHDGLW